jgi:hypothetical protein
MNDTEVLAIFYAHYPWLHCQANSSLLLKETSRPATIQTFVDAAKRLSFSLAVHRDFMAHYPALGHVAGRNLALDDPEVLQGAIAAEQTAEKTNERRERLHLQQEITQGKSLFYVRNQFGVPKAYSGKDGHEYEYSPNAPRRNRGNWFMDAPIETVRAIRDQLAAERGVRGKSADELRSVVNPNPHRDQQIGGDFKTTCSPGSTTQQQEVAEDFVLTHPDTGEPFTKATVIAFLNHGNSSENAKRILVRQGRVFKPAETALLRLLGKIK